MTKHQDLDIENMTQTDILNVILKGDKISIECDGIDGLLTRTVEHVRKERQVKLHGPFVALLKAFPNNGMTVTRIERPIPEVTLPTVPGYYLFSSPDGAESVWVLRNGAWTESGDPLFDDLIENIKNGASLTRLVPETEVAPAKLAGRVDPLKVGSRMDQIIGHEKLYETEGAELIAAIDNGELDK